MDLTAEGHQIYDMPDYDGGWMRSSPTGHNEYVRRIDKKLNGKVKPLIRFMKAWNYYRNVPILSCYLELRETKYASGESTIIYPIDVKNALNNLYSIGLANIQDPVGAGGSIPATTSATRKADALSKLETAIGRAEKAVAAANAGKLRDAFYWWDQVFDGKFPAYG